MVIRWLAVAAAGAAVTGCLGSGAVRCEDGRICPGGTSCTPHWCVTEAQMNACAGRPELEACTIGGDDGLCQEGACIREGCGDRQIRFSEECDRDVLGESTDCTDLGYYEPGPLACTALCTYDVSACTRRCGDGVLDADREDCDAAPGVTAGSCTRYGFYEGDLTCTAACTDDTSACRRRCGDGVLDPEELCEPSIEGSTPAGSCLEFGYDAGRFGCSAFCGPGFAGCRAIGWRRAFVTEEGQWEKVWVAPSGDLVAIGDGLEALHVTGGVPTIRELNVASSPAALWGASPDEVYVVTNGGEITRWDGMAWATMASPTTEALHGIWGTGPGELWAVGAGQRVMRGDGASWTTAYDGPDDVTLFDVWASGPEDVYAVGAVEAGVGGVILHHDGNTWTQVFTTPDVDFTAVWGSGPSDVFAAGSGFEAFHFDGIDWTGMGIFPSFAPIQDLWGRGSDDVYAVDSNGVIRHYDGASWWPLDFSSPVALEGVGGNADDLFIVPLNDVLMRYAGAAWSSASIESSALDVSIGSDGELAVAGGAVLRRGSTAWTDTDAPVGPYQSLWVHSRSAVFAGDDSGGVRRFDGVEWSALPSPGGAASALWGAGPADLWALTGGASAAHWNGTTWTPTSTGAAATLSALSGTSGTDLFAVGESGGTGVIRHYDGVGWSDMAPPSGGPLSSVWAAAPDDVWAVGPAGTILHYNGAAWSTMPSGVDVDLRGVHGAGPDDVWAVGAQSTILHYDGVSWEPVRSSIEATYDDVAVHDRLVVLAASDGSLITLVRDATW